MKPSFALFLLMTTTAPLAAQAAPRAVRPAPRPHTVLECYDLLPNGFFVDEDRRKLLGKEWPGARVDTAKDFLQSGGEAGQPSIQVAIFRFAGTELVGVAAIGELGNTLNFYRFKNGKLRDVTRQTLPIAFKKSQIARLPRIGTTIKVSNGDPDTSDEKPAYDLLWRGGRFVVRRP